MLPHFSWTTLYGTWLEEIVEIRWQTGCQGLLGKCSDFELYSVVDRKPVEVTKWLTC